MKVIAITSSDSIQGVVVVNDDEADVVKKHMDTINNRRPLHSRCMIEVFKPDDISNAFDYLKAF